MFVHIFRPVRSEEFDYRHKWRWCLHMLSSASLMVFALCGQTVFLLFVLGFSVCWLVFCFVLFFWQFKNFCNHFHRTENVFSRIFSNHIVGLPVQRSSNYDPWVKSILSVSGAKFSLEHNEALHLRTVCGCCTRDGMVCHVWNLLFCLFTEKGCWPLAHLITKYLPIPIFQNSVLCVS